MLHDLAVDHGVDDIGEAGMAWELVFAVLERHRAP